MNNKCWLAGILTVSALAMTANTLAHAGVKAESVSLSFAGGSEFFDSKRNLKNTSVGIVALDYQFTDNWGIQAFYGKFTTKYKPSENYDRSVNGRLFLVDGSFHFMPEKTFSPYLLAGIGISGINSSQFDATQQANINAGVGVQYFADEIISFHVEARDIYTMVGGKNDVLLAAGVNINLNWC